MSATPGTPPAATGAPARCAGWVAAHPGAAALAIAALAALALALIVYYRGVGPLGPFARRGFVAGAAAAAPPPKGDPETESLIEVINAGKPAAPPAGAGGAPAR